MPAGRPTSYKPEYCDLLIKHLEQGLSIECFAAVVDVCEDTIYEWFKVHEQFSEAKRRGLPKSRMQWEKIGMLGTTGKMKNFNCSSWIFNMKNRFKWTDKQEVSVDKETVFKLAYNVDNKDAD